MSDYVEVHGQSLKTGRNKERTADLHHIRVYAHEDGNADSPKWVVEHYASEDDSRPTAHEFDDGHDMLAHLANAASVPESAHGPNDDLGREVLPRKLQNRYGRGR